VFIDDEVKSAEEPAAVNQVDHIFEGEPTPSSPIPSQSPLIAPSVEENQQHPIVYIVTTADQNNIKSDVVEASNKEVEYDGGNHYNCREPFFFIFIL